MCDCNIIIFGLTGSTVVTRASIAPDNAVILTNTLNSLSLIRNSDVKII